MRIYISYFYNIRFFPQNLIPVSTAVWDPKWYHQNKGPKYGFVDKRGVINGLRIEELHPDIPEEDVCVKDCPKDPKNCSFLKLYKEQISAVDFSKVMERLHYLADNSKAYLKLEEDVDVCLMVYEKPDNPCSERQPLIEYFAENGVEVTEWLRDKNE